MAPTEAQYQLAIRRLNAGELVAFPTETVYGLGADALNPQALARVFALKGRPTAHPLIAHVGERQQVAALAREWSATAEQLAQRFWPGPLTLVVPKRASVPAELTGQQDSVAIRMPDHPIALELLRRFAKPLAAPSANRFGAISPTQAAHVRAEFSDAPELLILDGGPARVGIESTIVSLVAEPLLLRPGQIALDELKSLLPTLRVASDAEGPKASGRLESHYAPKTPTQWVSHAHLATLASDAAVLAFTPKPPKHRGLWITAANDPTQYAHDLYAHLRHLDAAKAASIYVERLPATRQWAAILDRLERACYPVMK